MPALWRDKLRPQVQSLYPGLLATLVTAIAATFLGQHYGAPVMLFALLLGMVLNFLSQENACRAGIELASRQILRIGIALLGLRITTHQLTALGWEPVLMVISGLVVTIGVGFITARAMGFNKFFGFLSGVLWVSAALLRPWPFQPCCQHTRCVNAPHCLQSSASVCFPPSR